MCTIFVLCASNLHVPFFPNFSCFVWWFKFVHQSTFSNEFVCLSFAAFFKMAGSNYGTLYIVVLWNTFPGSQYKCTSHIFCCLANLPSWWPRALWYIQANTHQLSTQRGRPYWHGFFFDKERSKALESIRKQARFFFCVVVYLPPPGSTAALFSFQFKA